MCFRESRNGLLWILLALRAVGTFKAVDALPTQLSHCVFPNNLFCVDVTSGASFCMYPDELEGCNYKQHKMEILEESEIEISIQINMMIIKTKASQNN